MSKKELSFRKCVACNQMFYKDQLFRLVKTDGQVSVDLTYKAQGRGAYVCRKTECLDLAVKKKAFNRALKGPVPEEIISSLYTELENGSR